MFEDFRKQLLDDEFPDDDQKKTPSINITSDEPRYFLGLRPVQRFIVAFLLLVMTFAMGVLFLLVTSRMVPPL